MNFGDLNNIVKEGWEYINGVAKNISKESLQQGWDTYMVQSQRELADVARASMVKKESVLKYLDMNGIDNAYAAADKGNADFIKEFNKLKTSLNAGNTDEAKTIATTISERFQDGQYLKLLQEAEGKYNNITSQINNPSISNSAIHSKYKKDFDIPDAAKKFVTDEQKDKIADMAYKLQGKKQYFNSGDAKTNQIRAGVTAGAYMGTMTTARLIQGGSPITNEYGERDIVGIPFI